MDIVAILNSGLWGPIIILPVFFWGIFSIFLFFIMASEFKKKRDYKSARELRYTMLAVLATPLAAPLVAVGLVGVLEYFIVTKGKVLWNNSIGLIWQALWMKENENDLDADRI